MRFTNTSKVWWRAVSPVSVSAVPLSVSSLHKAPVCFPFPFTPTYLKYTCVTLHSFGSCWLISTTKGRELLYWVCMGNDPVGIVASCSMGRVCVCTAGVRQPAKCLAFSTTSLGTRLWQATRVQNSQPSTSLPSRDTSLSHSSEDEGWLVMPWG